MQDYSSPGQRVLAAIMFTDVVGFSMLMGRDESGTLRNLERDFALMEQECALQGGQVLKRTGDGLLMHFVSAADAVQAALSIQHILHEQARRLAPAQLLDHRMGIHLGDVVMTENDIVGDGVNVAQRLQGEAKPGGICMSQTVYEVVKNKIKVNAISLGPRNLKHLVDPVVVWSVPPLGGAGMAHRLTATPPVDGLELGHAEVAEPSRGRALLIMLGAIVALAVAMVGVLTIMKNSARQAKETELAVAKAAKDREARDAARKQQKDAATTPDAPAQTTTTNPPATSVDEDADIAAPVTDLERELASDPERLAAIAALRKNYDFTQIAERIASSSIGNTPRGRQFVKHYERLARFIAFLQGNVAQTSKDTPLDVMGSKLAGDGTAMLVLGTDAAWTTLTFPGMQPAGIIAIADAVLALKPNLATPEVNREMLGFRREFSLTGDGGQASGQPDPGQAPN